MTDTHILIVEDELVIALEIESRLEKLGYSVEEIATSGEDAIKKAERNRC